MNLPPGPDEQIDLGFEENSLEIMEQYFHEYGDIYKVFSPYRKTYTYVVSHPEYVREVLIVNQKNYVKGVGIDRVKILLGNGIMVSEGEYWKRQRRMIQPSFHKKVIANMADIMISNSYEVLERWSGYANNKEKINITEETSDVTLQIVLRSIFSNDLEKTITATGMNPFDLVRDETRRDLKFAMKFRNLGKVIKQYKEAREAENRTEFDFLSMLIASRDKETGERMTDKELLDEIMTLIIAGHETTAGTLNWVWYLLATHPDVYEKLFIEISRLNGKAPQFDQLEEFPYSRQVIQESMRLYPPGWILTRRATADQKLGEFDVPTKTDVFVSPWLVHRNPKLWNDPDKFIPERFEESKIKQRHKYSYFPFAAGPRQCIGDFFAMVEMQVHLILLAQHFQLEYLDEKPLELEPQVNLRTRHDLFFKLTKR